MNYTKAENLELLKNLSKYSHVENLFSYICYCFFYHQDYK